MLMLMPIPSFRVAAAFAALMLAGLAAPPAVLGQQSTAAGGGLTLLSSAPAARIAIQGTSTLSGPSPLELPAGWSGRFSVRLGAPGYATGQGVIAFPTAGAPYSLSEAPGLSSGLLLRSLNLPGLPALSSGHKARGLLLAAAAAGAGYGAARSQVLHDRNIDLADWRADDRAEENRLHRNRWFAYGGAVWAVSALDYMVRPRVRILETTPQRITLGVPRVTRGGMLWRSILVPGAGQEFGNQRARGLFWLGATLASGAAFVIAEGAVDHRSTDAQWARAEVDSAGPFARADRIRDLERALSTLESARDLRDGFRAAILTVHAANVLDALVAPIRKDDGPGPPRLTFGAPVGSRRAALALSYRF